MIHEEGAILFGEIPTLLFMHVRLCLTLVTEDLEDHNYLSSDQQI